MRQIDAEEQHRRVQAEHHDVNNALWVKDDDTVNLQHSGKLLANISPLCLVVCLSVSINE